MVDESIVEDTQRFVVEETSDLSGVSDDPYVRLRDSCRQSYIQCIHQGRNNVYSRSRCHGHSTRSQHMPSNISHESISRESAILLHSMLMTLKSAKQ